jgi:transposase
LRAVDQGKSRQQIVEVLGVSLSTIKRYLKQRREQGHVRPKAIPGRVPSKRQPLVAGLEPQLQAYPDATLEQHCELWEQAHGEPVSRWTMSRAIKELSWTRKKSPWQPVNATRRSEPTGANR